MSDLDLHPIAPNQLLWNDEFRATIQQNPSGTYSIRGLTMHDLRRIKAALSMDLTNANVDAHKAAPHWWNEAESGSHVVWFESHARYYREAVAVFEKAGIT